MLLATIFFGVPAAMQHWSGGSSRHGSSCSIFCFCRVTAVNAHDIPSVHSNINEHFWKCSDSIILLTKHKELVVFSKSAASVRQIHQMVLPGKVQLCLENHDPLKSSHLSMQALTLLPRAGIGAEAHAR